MADPLTIVGCVGAICNIIDATGKTISMLNGLRNRWATADLTLLTLGSQLTAIRAALSKIQGWLQGSHAQELHYQLFMDLDVSVACCRLLIEELGAFLSGLDTFGDRPLDFAHRLKVAFSHRRVDDIEKLLQQQTSALTLLLTALNCTTLSEQDRSLKKLRSIRGVERSRKDSASLFGIRDASSFASKGSDNLSKISFIFDFDPDLLSSQVYQRVVRSSLKQAWRQPRQLPPKPFRVERVLLLGDDELGKDRIVNMIHEQRLQQCTDEDIATCRLPRLKACLDHTKSLIRTMDEYASSSSQRFSGTQQYFLMGLSLDSDVDPAMEEQMIDAMIATWDKALDFPPTSYQNRHSIAENTPRYFLRELENLRLPDRYPPTAADFLKAQACHGKHEITSQVAKRYPSKRCQITVLRIPDSTRYVKVDFLPFVDQAFVVIDLGRYDLILAQASNLLQVLATTLSRREDSHHSSMSLVIFFSNSDKFDDRLSMLPLEECIPGYDGDNSLQGLRSYFSRIFRGHLRFTFTCIELPEDTEADLVDMVTEYRLWALRSESLDNYYLRECIDQLSI